jgi:hypothetical protein
MAWPGHRTSQIPSVKMRSSNLALIGSHCRSIGANTVTVIDSNSAPNGKIRAAAATAGSRPRLFLDLLATERGSTTIRTLTPFAFCCTSALVITGRTSGMASHPELRHYSSSQGSLHSSRGKTATHRSPRFCSGGLGWSFPKPWEDYSREIIHMVLAAEHREDMSTHGDLRRVITAPRSTEL